jgi:hypothetical protein
MQPSDLNSDGVVDVIDLSILVSRWGTSDPDADINNDGIVDALDLSVLVSNWGEVSSGSGTALLVTNESVLSAGNQALYDRLVTLGYSVVTRLDSAPVDYAGIDVIVTGSITGSNINGKYANPDVGVVCVDSWPHFGLGSSIGYQNNVDTLQVTQEAHPLAGDLANGNHIVYGTPGYLVWSTNYNAATAVVAAVNPGNPTQPIVFGYEAGAQMATAYATTRHVGLGLHQNVRANMTAAGWALFDAAVAWAAASAYVAPPPPSAPTNLNATAGDMQVSLSWNSVAGATSYSVKRSTVSGGPYSIIVSNHTTTSYIDSSLTNGSTYYYVVSASNAEGESSNSVQVSAVPVEGGGTPSGERLLYTDAEIAEYTTRMSGAGPYYSTGDVSSNSPNDGARAVTKANNFLANPSASEWVQTVPMVEMSTDEPHGEQHARFMHAAWCYMTQASAISQSNRNAMAAAVKSLLLSRATHANHDYWDESKWDVAWPGYVPNPFFAHAEWMVRLIKARDMLGRDYFTSAENNTFDRWLYGYANYVFHWFHMEATDISSKNDKRLVRNYEDVGWGFYEDSSEGFDGSGLRMRGGGHGYTNRHATTVMAAGLAINYLKRFDVTPPAGSPSYGVWTVDEMVDQSLLFIEEQLKAAWYPVGMQQDFGRGSSGSPATGWRYSINVANTCIFFALYHARRGDMSVWNYGTTDGWRSSAGAPSSASPLYGGPFSQKSLHHMVWSMVKYVNDSWSPVRRLAGNIMVGSSDFHDVHPAAVASRFAPTDTTLAAAATRSGEGFPAYPSSPTNQGPWHGHDGQGAMWIGLIEHGGMPAF